jgi:hypothetical protein
MDAVPYKVRIVVDRNFGERLAELASDVPVWIVDTPPNEVVAHRLRKERNQNITKFSDWPSSSPEDLLISEFAMINLHHPMR